MGCRGHHLYQLHIEKTQSRQYAHIGATNTHSFVAPMCAYAHTHTAPQITTTVLENNHQGLQIQPKIILMA